MTTTPRLRRGFFSRGHFKLDSPGICFSGLGFGHGAYQRRYKFFCLDMVVWVSCWGVDLRGWRGYFSHRGAAQISLGELLIAICGPFAFAGCWGFSGLWFLCGVARSEGGGLISIFQGFSAGIGGDFRFGG